MTWLIILGTLITVAGLVGLGICIKRASAIRRAGDADQARAQMHSLVALNMASVGTAGFGLALVVIGLIL